MAWSARQLVERGEPDQALRQIEQILAQEPGHVDAQRLRQDLMRLRGRKGHLLLEAAAAVRERPQDGVARYLLARVTDDPKAKLAGFEEAARLAPDLVWPWLGLSHTLRGSDLERALAIYRDLYAASEQHPLVGVAYASALRSAERWDEAELVYQAMRADRRVPGVGDLGLAQVALSQDDRGTAWAALLEALRRRPFDSGVRLLLNGWLETTATKDQARQVLDVLRENGERMRAFGAGAGARLLAGLLRDGGQLQAARSLLEERLAERATPKLHRDYRRLLLAMGEVDAFVAEVRATIPMHVVDVEANQLRGRWLKLLRGPFYGGDVMADAERVAALADGLRDCGLLPEVELLCDAARQRFPERNELWTERQDEVRREMAFEAGLRRLLYRGYQSRDTADLDTVLESCRQLSQRVLGKDCVGTPAQFSVPLVGEMMDPFAGDLAAHLARYNRHLVLGRRSGGTAEGLMVTRLSVVELPEKDRLDLPGRCYEVVGIDRDVKALGGVLGSDLAGVALLNHFLIDYDAVVDWANGLLDRRKVARRDRLALQRDAIPPSDGPAGVGLAPVDVSWRLTLASPTADEDLEPAVLAMIRDHERRHLVDSFHYMPIESNLLRGAGLLFAFGLSPSAIEAEMERRAELAALALSPHTELVLAHIVDFFGDPPLPSPHHRGFSELLEQLHGKLIELGVPAELAVPSRWHELDMAKVREAAGKLLAELP